MLLNAAAVRGLIPNVPPLSPRFMGPPPPVSVKRKALFSPTGSRDFPHPVKFENLVPSICLYKHRFKDEEPAYFQLKHGKGRKSCLTDRAAANLLREYELVKAGALPGTCADVLEHYQTTKATISRLNKRLKATGTTDSRKKRYICSVLLVTSTAAESRPATASTPRERAPLVRVGTGGSRAATAGPMGPQRRLN